MVQTHKGGLVPWMNTILAYFFHGLDERVRIRSSYASQEAMQDEVRDISVEFQPHDDGGRLIATHAYVMGENQASGSEDMLRDQGP